MRKKAKEQVIVSVNAQHTLFQDVHQRRNIEACGVLIGSIDTIGNWHIAEAYPLCNIAQSPVYFEFAPEDLLAVELDHPDQIVGVYHSHPTGLAVASSTDRGNMKRVNLEQRIPWVWLIVNGPFHGAFTPDRYKRENLPLVAYHHYEQLGLRQVTIQFEAATRAQDKSSLNGSAAATPESPPFLPLSTEDK